MFSGNQSVLRKTTYFVLSFPAKLFDNGIYMTAGECMRALLILFLTEKIHEFNTLKNSNNFTICYAY